jgi:putative transposase
MGVSRPRLAATATEDNHRPRTPYSRSGDADALAQVREVIDERASYGYRRVTAKQPLLVSTTSASTLR